MRKWLIIYYKHLQKNCLEIHSDENMIAAEVFSLKNLKSKLQIVAEAWQFSHILYSSASEQRNRLSVKKSITEGPKV